MASIGTWLYTKLKGKRIGADQFGNRYYRERRRPKNRRERRWVVYQGLAEPSKVPAQWHGWLHHMTDILPTERDFPDYAWLKPHLPNLTGTTLAYKPKGHASRGGERARATGDYQPWQP